MPDSLRLMFEYRDGEYVALEPVRVDMTLPDEDEIVPERSAGGRFVELRSADGGIIRSAYLGGDYGPTVEFPSGDPDRPFGRTEPPPGAIVTVIVPADDRATHAALVEVSTDRSRAGETRTIKRDLSVVAIDRGGEQ